MSSEEIRVRLSGDLGNLPQAAQQAESAIKRIGTASDVSAKQTAAALRTLPSQFTDIATQLQGGASPLTVLLQQGGQIKDSFGGVSNALRGVGSAIGPYLTNPITYAVAAAGTLALAYNRGAAEVDGYTRALVLSGNAAGTSAGRLADAARRVSSVVGTQGAAAEALTQLAGAANVDPSGFEKFAAAAVAMERAAGVPIKQTVDELASLGKSPLESALRLNEASNFLTLGLYQQIKALQDVGKTTSAAALAQSAYADALSSRATQLQGSLGAIERGWSGVKASAAAAWDAMLNVGRPVTMGEQLGKAQKALDDTAKANAKGNRNAFADLRTQGLQDTVDTLQESIRLEGRAAQARQQATDQVKARVAFDKLSEESLSNQEQYARAIAQAETAAADAGASQAEKAKVLAAIRAKYSPTKDYDDLIAKIRDKVAADQTELEQGAALTEGQKLSLGVMEQLRDGKLKFTQAQAISVTASLNELLAVEQQMDARKVLAKLEAESARQSIADYEARTNASEALLQSLFERGKALQAELDMGRKATQAEQDLIKLDEDLATGRLQLSAADEASARALAAQNLERERNVSWLTETARANDALFASLDKTAVSLQQQVEKQREQNLQIGLTADAVDRLEAAKLLDTAASKDRLATLADEIDWSGQMGDAYRREAAALRELAALKGEAADKKFAKEEAAEWKRTSDQIESALTGAFEGAFNAAERGFKSLRDYIESSLKQYVARQAAQGLANYATSAYAAWMGNGSTGGASGSTSQNLAYAQQAGSYSSSIQAYAAARNNSGAAQGAGTAGSSGAAAGSAAVFWIAAAVLGAIKANSDYSEGYTVHGARRVGQETYGVSGTYEDSQYGLFRSLGVSDRLSNLLSGTTAVARIFGRADPRVTAAGLAGTLGGEGGASLNVFQDIYEKGGLLRRGKDYRVTQALDADTATSLQGAARGVQDTARSYLQALGIATDGVKSFTQAIAINLQGLSTKDQQAAVSKALSGYGDALVQNLFGQVDQFSQGTETAGETLRRLVDDLSVVNGSLDLLGHTALTASVASASAAEDLAGQLGGIQALRNVTSSYFDQYYSDAERTATQTRLLTEQLAKLGFSLPGTRAQYRALVDAQDLTTQTGRDTYAALLTLSDAFAGITQDAKAAALNLDGLAGEIARLRGTSGNGLDGLGLAGLQAMFATQTASARSGSQSAIDQLPALSQAIEQAARAGARTSGDVAAVRAQLAASLSTTAELLQLAGGTAALLTGTSSSSAASTLAAGGTVTAGSSSSTGAGGASAAQSDVLRLLQAVQTSVEALRTDQGVGLLQIATNTGKVSRLLDNAVQQAGALNVRVIT